MEKYYIIGLAIILVLFYFAKAKLSNSKEHDEIDYSNSYSQRWLFSQNEKVAHKKIQAVTDELGLLLFAKVRLLDLVEPKKGISNYKGALWKIQAKHVDFVVCDSKLVARTIIELDDKSHLTHERQKRDIFVDEVLKNAGYKVIRINSANNFDSSLLI